MNNNYYRNDDEDSRVRRQKEDYLVCNRSNNYSME